MDLGVIHRGVDAWNAGDYDGFMQTLSADSVLVTDPRFPEGGTFEGRDAIRGFYKNLREGWEGGTSVDLHDLREVGGRVLGQFTWRGTGATSGVETSIEVSCLWTIRDGQVARAEFFFDRDAAMTAAGPTTTK